MKVLKKMKNRDLFCRSRPARSTGLVWGIGSLPVVSCAWWLLRFFSGSPCSAVQSWAPGGDLRVRSGVVGDGGDGARPVGSATTGST